MTEGKQGHAWRNHYTPQFYLRRWVSGADNRLWQYKRTASASRSSAASTVRGRAPLTDVEKELESTNAYLHAIVENIPDMIFVKDAKTHAFKRLNRAGEELLGKTDHEGASGLLPLEGRRDPARRRRSSTSRRSRSRRSTKVCASSTRARSRSTTPTARRSTCSGSRRTSRRVSKQSRQRASSPTSSRGARAEAVRELAGHSSLVVTQRYAHATDDDRRAAVNKLSE